MVGSTWKYANKGGSRDKRYKDNREIPVMEYGELTLHVNGQEIVIMTSNANVPQMVKEGILHYAASLAVSSPCQTVNSIESVPDRMYNSICKYYALQGDLHNDKLER